MSNIPAQPLPSANRQPAPASYPTREPDVAPSFEALLRHIRQEVARLLQLPPESRAKEEPAIRSLYTRAVSRYGTADKAALPPPLKQIDAYLRISNPAESLSKYLDVRRADLALDDRLLSDGDDKDAIGEPSPDAGRDSDEDAIGSEHPKSPSLGPFASPAGAQRQLPPRLPTPSPSSPRPTSGNTTVSSPEPRSTVSAPPRGEKRKHAPEPGPNDTVFEGDARCSNCILRNAKQCIVEPSRQRCNTCFAKRHRCSKVLTPPTRPSRDKSGAKGKGSGDAPPDVEGGSARAPKRKRAVPDEDTKRVEPAAKRPVRPARPAATAAAGPSNSASAPVQRPAAPKKPSMPNGNAAGPSNNAAPQTLSMLAMSASRAPRAPTAPAANANGQSRYMFYQEKLQVVSGILGMVQGAVKEMQDQLAADVAAGRFN